MVGSRQQDTIFSLVESQHTGKKTRAKLSSALDAIAASHTRKSLYARCESLVTQLGNATD